MYVCICIYMCMYVCVCVYLSIPIYLHIDTDTDIAIDTVFFLTDEVGTPQNQQGEGAAYKVGEGLTPRLVFRLPTKSLGTSLCTCSLQTCYPIKNR